MTPWQAWAANSPHPAAPAWTEAAQLALLWGDEATALDGRWTELFRGLRTLGAVTTMIENEACALAVTAGLGPGDVLDDGWELRATDLRLTLWRDMLGFAFATGTPRRRALPAGFTLHDNSGQRTVAMELDESDELGPFAALARARRATHELHLPRGSGAAPTAGPAPRIDGPAPQAWARAWSRAELDRWLQLRGHHRGQAYRLLAGRSTTPLSARGFVERLSARYAADEQLCLAVGRAGGVLRVRTTPARLGCSGPQLVLQADALALAVDLRFVAECWAVELESQETLELLDDRGGLMLRIGPSALFDATERPLWTARTAR
jgi:putative heme degradation protein